MDRKESAETSVPVLLLSRRASCPFLGAKTSAYGLVLTSYTVYQKVKRLWLVRVCEAK